MYLVHDVTHYYVEGFQVNIYRQSFVENCNTDVITVGPPPAPCLSY